MKNHIAHARSILTTRRAATVSWSRLEREVAGYDHPAQQQDLAATLDRFADQDTTEMRHFLAAQAVHA